MFVFVFGYQGTRAMEGCGLVDVRRRAGVGIFPSAYLIGWLYHLVRLC